MNKIINYMYSEILIHALKYDSNYIPLKLQVPAQTIIFLFKYVIYYREELYL